MCTTNGMRFEFECHHTSHLYKLKHVYDRGLVKAALLIQSVCWILGGAGSHPHDVSHMKRTADRLFGDACHWSVLDAGRAAISNAEQVRMVREVISGMGLDIATPNEARGMPGPRDAIACHFEMSARTAVIYFVAGGLDALRRGADHDRN